MTAHSLRERFKATVTEAILDAAEDLAADVGVPATNLQAVAKRAGVAVGTIYNHFEDRNELFAELFRRRRAELLETLDAVAKASPASAFATQLETFVRTVLSFFDARRAFLRLALDGSTKAPLARPKRPGEAQTSMVELTARAERIVRVGLKEKRLRADAAELAPHFLVSAIRTVLVARVDAPTALAGETASVVALFLRGAAR